MRQCLVFWLSFFLASVFLPKLTQGLISYQYDDSERLTSVAYEDASISYTYDEMGNLLHIQVEGDGMVLVVDKVALEVAEGSTARLQVKLSRAPTASLDVTVTKGAGDDDLSVSAGSEVTFDLTNWDVFQPVTLAAAADGDAVHGSATFLVEAPGLPVVIVVVREVDDEAPDCSFAFDRTSRELVTQGGTDDVHVITSPECSWTAASQASWITVSSGVSYTGSGTVTYNVAENTGSGARTGSLSIAGEIYEIIQSGTVEEHAVTVVRSGSGVGSVTSSPAGIACGPVCSSSFSDGTAVILTASPAVGSRFAGWFGPCTGTGSCSFEARSSTTVTAVFEPVVGFDIISTDPAPGDTGLSIRAGVKVDFNDAVQEGPDFDNITLVDGNGATIPISVFIFSDRKLALVDPQTRLEHATIYNLRIPAGAFQNMRGDPLTGEVVVSWTTADPGALRLLMAAESRWLLEGRSVGASVWFDRPADVARTVTLGTSGGGTLTLPAQLTIPAGTLKADFTVTVKDNAVHDGDRQTTLIATASTGEQASVVFEVHDDDTPNSGSIQLSGGWIEADDDGDGLFEAGERADLIAQVTNFGSTFVPQVDLTGEVLDTFEISPLGSPPHGSVTGLASGASKTDDISLVASRDTPPGRYHVRVGGNAGGLVFESYLSIDLVNDQLPDYRVSDGNVGTITVDPGWIDTLQFVVFQHGNGWNAALPRFVVYMESADGIETIYESFSLARGYFESEEIFDIRIDAPSEPGNYRFWAEIDSDARIPEVDETNNVSGDITVTVREPNDPPVLDPVNDGSVAAGRLYTTTLSASDPDLGQTLTFSLVDAPAGASIQADTGVFSWDPAPDLAPGAYPVTVRVTDNGSTVLTDTSTFSINVFREANISVMQSNGVSALVPGQSTTYEVTVANLGPSIATGVTVEQAATALLTDMLWSCEATSGSQCPASGNGFLSASIDLAARGSVVFRISVWVVEGVSGILSHEITVAAPDGVDPEPGNDQATDQDVLLALDYGDAPDAEVSAFSWRYPTRREENGARHGLTGSLFLGTFVDGEADGQPSIDATSDDSTAADEDGLIFETPFAVCETARLTVVSSGAGFLDAWVDWNADGHWTGERVFLREPLVLGSNPLEIAVPCTTAPVAETFARFRVSTAGGLEPTGLALDGEVEDYRVAVHGRDFADAPDPSFPTLLESQGPRHVLANGLHLGESVDAEMQGFASPMASGDDTDGADDEDGVIFASALVPGQPATVQINASMHGLVDAWIDWNGDGDWLDAGEQVLTSETAWPGTTKMNLAVPVGAAPGIQTTARFRLSSAGGLGVDGLAFDGEVEDHALEIAALADLAVSLSDARTTAAPGESLTYTAVVYNDGPSPVIGVPVRIELPSILASAVWTCDADPNARCTVSGTGSVDDVVDLPPGGRAIYSLGATVRQGASGVLAVTATATAPATVVDPDLTTNSAVDEDVLGDVSDVGIAQESDDVDVLPGRRVTYRVTVTNAGPSDAVAVTVRDLASPALTDVTWSCSALQGAVCSPSGTGDLVDTADVPVGASLHYELSGTLGGADPIPLEHGRRDPVPRGDGSRFRQQCHDLGNRSESARFRGCSRRFDRFPLGVSDALRRRGSLARSQRRAGPRYRCRRGDRRAA